MKSKLTSHPTDIFSGSNTLAILTFTVGEQAYSLPVTQVVRIIEMVAITRLPGTPKIIRGVINVQGKTVPIIDLRYRFGLSTQAYGLHTPIILADTGNGQTMGFIVDSVEDVVEVSRSHLATPETILPAELEQQITSEVAYLAGVITIEQQMIIVLNARALLTSTEQTILHQVLDDQEAVIRTAPQAGEPGE